MSKRRKLMYIVYYRDLHVNLVKNIRIFDTRCDAYAYFEKLLKDHYTIPVKYGSPALLGNNGQIKVGAMRYFMIRRLDDDEEEAYKKYGKNCVFKLSTNTLVAGKEKI